MKAKCKRAYKISSIRDWITWRKRKKTWGENKRSSQGKGNHSIKINKNGNGVYIFVINGCAIISEKTLDKRDALCIWDVENFNIIDLGQMTREYDPIRISYDERISRKNGF